MAQTPAGSLGATLHPTSEGRSRQKRHGSRLLVSAFAGIALLLHSVPSTFVSWPSQRPSSSFGSSISRTLCSTSRAARGGEEYDDDYDQTEDSEQGQRAIAVAPMSWGVEKPRTPTLPPEIFKPKQSLSQNFLADPNYVFKMTKAVKDDSPGGKRVLELGPGTGALTMRLHKQYPEMFAVELDQRAMRVLAQNAPGVTCVRSDVLFVNYTKLAEIRGGPLTVVGNLPYHVTSQILFTLLDHHASVKTATVTMQKEVAERICARPGNKKYGIPSVAFQLYTDPKILFDIPPTAFFPRPNVISSYVEFNFEDSLERRRELNVEPRDLRNLTATAFRQRRKMMQNSLAKLLECSTTLISELPPEYAKLRPEQIEPWEFVHLTQLVFGKKQFPRHLRLAWRGEFGRTVRE